MLLADIATGHHAAADILFLIAAIVFGIAAFFGNPAEPPHPLLGRFSLVAVGLCLLAIAWLIL
jgi:hypothetical protein